MQKEEINLWTTRRRDGGGPRRRFASALALHYAGTSNGKFEDEDEEENEDDVRLDFGRGVFFQGLDGCE